MLGDRLPAQVVANYRPACLIEILRNMVVSANMFSQTVLDRPHFIVLPRTEGQNPRHEADGMGKCRRVYLGGSLPPALEQKVKTLGMKPTA